MLLKLNKLFNCPFKDYSNLLDHILLYFMSEKNPNCTSPGIIVITPLNEHVAGTLREEWQQKQLNEGRNASETQHDRPAYRKDRTPSCLHQYLASTPLYIIQIIFMLDSSNDNITMAQIHEN